MASIKLNRFFLLPLFDKAYKIVKLLLENEELKLKELLLNGSCNGWQLILLLRDNKVIKKILDR